MKSRFRTWRCSATLLAAACRPAPSPAALYTEAAKQASVDPLAAGAACARLDASLADECRTLSAHAAAPNHPTEAEALCAAVESPFWRGECWFLVAEALVPTLGGADAAARCAEAGSFRGNCLDHVWRAHAVHLLSSQAFSAAHSAYRPARQWADGLLSQPDSAVTQRFWQSFYDAPLHDPTLPPLDLAACATLVEGQPECARRLPAAFRHTLSRVARERALQHGGLDLAAACSPNRSLAERIEGAYGVRYVPSEGLDALATRALGAVCRRIPGG